MGITESIALISDLAIAVIEILPLADYATAHSISCVNHRMNCGNLIALFRRLNRVSVIIGSISIKDHYALQQNGPLHGQHRITGAMYMYKWPLIANILNGISSRWQSANNINEMRYIYGQLQEMYYRVINSPAFQTYVVRISDGYLKFVTLTGELIIIDLLTSDGSEACAEHIQHIREDGGRSNICSKYGKHICAGLKGSQYEPHEPEIMERLNAGYPKRLSAH